MEGVGCKMLSPYSYQLDLRVDIGRRVRKYSFIAAMIRSIDFIAEIPRLAKPTIRTQLFSSDQPMFLPLLLTTKKTVPTHASIVTELVPRHAIDSASKSFRIVTMVGMNTLLLFKFSERRLARSCMVSFRVLVEC